MITKNNSKIDPKKVTAERFNGYALLFGRIAVVGAYATTGQSFQVSYDEQRN